MLWKHDIGILEFEKIILLQNRFQPIVKAPTRTLMLAKNGNAIDVDNKEMSQWVKIKTERDFQFLSFSRGCFMRPKIVWDPHIFIEFTKIEEIICKKMDESKFFCFRIDCNPLWKPKQYILQYFYSLSNKLFVKIWKEHNTPLTALQYLQSGLINFLTFPACF